MTEQTTRSAETASTEETPLPVGRVTSTLDRLLRQSGAHTSAERTRFSLTYGSLSVTRSDSGHMVTRQLYPWTLCSVGSALQQAMLDTLDIPGTPTSGEPVILVFATPSWRLLITSAISSSPQVSDGELFVYAQPEMLRILTAKLLAQPVPSEGISSRVRSVWRVVEPAADAEATSRFLSTVLQLALQRSTADSKGSK